MPASGTSKSRIVSSLASTRSTPPALDSVPTNREESRTKLPYVGPTSGGSSVSAAPSSPGLVPDPSSTSSTPPQQIAARTRLQTGIRKLKVYMDDTFWYGLLSTIDEPNDLSSALSDPHWKAAMESEYSALLCNNTWHLVPPAAGHNLIDCK
jgi:hypothetical protein